MFCIISIDISCLVHRVYLILICQSDISRPVKCQTTDFAHRYTTAECPSDYKTNIMYYTLCLAERRLIYKFITDNQTLNQKAIEIFI